MNGQRGAMPGLRLLLLSVLLVGCECSSGEVDAGPTCLMPVADCGTLTEAEGFCINTEYQTCRRDLFAGRITEAECRAYGRAQSENQDHGPEDVEVFHA